MTSLFENALSKYPRIEINGNQKLELQPNIRACYIDQGHIELFSVANLATKQRKRHLFTLPEKKLFFIHPAHKKSTRYLFPVATLQTHLIIIDDTAWQELEIQFKSEIDAYFQEWLKLLVDAIVKYFAPPKDYILITSENQTITAQKNSPLLSPKCPVYITFQNNKSIWCGQNYLPITEGTTLPLLDNLWITPESETTYTVTPLTYPKNAQQQSAIQEFMALLFKLENKIIEFEEDQLKKQIKNRLNYNQHCRETAFNNLSMLLYTKRKQLPPEISADPLIAACQYICSRSEIPFSQTKHTDKNNKDPLSTIVQSSNIKTRKVSLYGNWWQQDCGHLLGFLGPKKQPAALIMTKPGNYFLINTTQNTSHKLTPLLAAQLHTEAYYFYKPLPNQPLSIKALLQFGTKNTKKDFWHVIIMSGIIGLLGIVTPITMAAIFDHIIPSAEKTGLLQFSILLVLTALTTAIIQITRSYAILRCLTQSETTMLSGIWDRLIDLPLSFFKNYTVGDLVDRANGMMEIKEKLSLTYINVLFNSAFALANLIVMLYFNRLLTGLVLLYISACLLISYFVGKKEIQIQKELRDLKGQLSGLSLQFINGLNKIRLAAAELRAFAQWASLFTKQQRLSTQSRNQANGLWIFNETAKLIAIIVIFAYTYHFWKQYPHFSIGAFLAFNSAFTLLFFSLTDMINILIQSLSIVPILNRTMPILTTIKEVSIEKKDPSPLTGHIEASQLSFRYDKKGPNILSDISFEIKPNEFVAIVGHSGSGKSTLLRLLLGFEKPINGALYYDNQNLDRLDIKAVRRNFGVVLQQSRVLPGDILSNIIGSSPLTIDDAWSAAEMSGLADDIRAMPMQMHTFIVDGSSALSGGQRQRLMIARAIVKKPNIIFFDEATSALDNHSQACVIHSLEKRNITRILVAHRLSTIINADKIIVLDKGRIAKIGTFNELIGQKGVFKELAARQMF